MSSPLSPPEDSIATNGKRIPDVLRERDEWLVARVPSDGDGGKPPIAPDRGRSWNDMSRSLLSFDEAYDEARKIVKSGQIDTENGEQVALAYRFTSDDPFVGIDIDDLNELREILNLLKDFDGGYIEWSISKRGVHIIIVADASGAFGGKRFLGDSDGPTIEVYNRNRYFVVTGDAIGPSTVSRNVQTELDNLLTRTARESNEPSDWDQPMKVESPSPTETSSITEVGARSARQYIHQKGTKKPTVNQVIATASESDPGFEQLWRGDTSGYPSRSEADLALACKLAFWCQGDENLMDKCFRQSGCYGIRGQPEPKWDEVRYKSGETYGKRTLENARAGNPERYSGTYLHL